MTPPVGAAEAPQNKPNPKKYKAYISSRKVAYKALVNIYERGRFIDVALSEQEAYQKLPPQDRGFARWMVAGVIRHQNQLDRILEQFIHKHPPQRVQIILWLGILQLVFGDTSHHAAVNETVALCFRSTESFKGMVNAVLRNIIRGEVTIKISDKDLYNEFPQWMKESVQQSYGDQQGQDILVSSLKEAPLDISFRSDDEAQILMQRMPKAVPLPGGGCRLRNFKGRIDRIPGFRAGKIWIQDAAAQLPVKLLGNIEGKNILDVCAAPGGKTMQMLAKGAHVTALDISEKRLEKLSENLHRIDFKIPTITADALTWDHNGKTFDIVMLDAPCSATGTLRRHPEIMRQRSLEDVMEMSKLQKEILNKAQNWVNDHGYLMYVTCSMNFEEGERNIQEFLRYHTPLWEIVDLSTTAQDLKIQDSICSEGWLRTHPLIWSKINGMDSFFICLLKKNSSAHTPPAPLPTP